MLFKELLKGLNAMAKENPETLEMEAVYATDDEGNGFKKVYSNGTLGEFDEDDEFHTEDSYDEDEKGDFKPNAVCIN